MLDNSDDQAHFFLLGSIEITVGTSQVPVPKGRLQAVLVTLLMEANHVVGIDALIDTIWDEAPPTTARGQILMCISKLRRLFLERKVACPVVTRPPGYMLRIDHSQCDHHRFEDGVERAKSLARDGHLARATTELEEALALWRGPALGGTTISRELRNKAALLDARRLTAFEIWADLKIRLGHQADVTDQARLLVSQNPLRERLRGLLMLALYHSGRQAEALEVYRQGRDVLADELGLDPCDELRQLEKAILTGRTGPGVVASVETPATERARPAPRQLPPAIADFVGREELTGRVVGHLTGGDAAEGAVPVALLSGMPGVGKTALALRIAHRLATSGAYPDGQLYYDLDDRTGGGEAMLAHFLSALGVTERDMPPDARGRTSLYRDLTADRRILVVVDGVNTVQDVVPVLPGSDSAVVVTSRLRLTGTYTPTLFDVDPLDTDEAHGLLSRVVGSERVDRDAGAVDDLVRIVGGLPLAIRIASVRLTTNPHWSLRDLIARLRDESQRLDELTSGHFGVREPLLTVWDELGDGARRLLGLIGILGRPDVPAWVLTAVLGDLGVRGDLALAELIEKRQLVVEMPTRPGETRHRPPELVRVLAREQTSRRSLGSTDVAAVTRAVSGWTVLAQTALATLTGVRPITDGTETWQPPRDVLNRVRADPLGWVRAEQDALLAAVTAAADASLDRLCCDLMLSCAPLLEAAGRRRARAEVRSIAWAACSRSGNELALSQMELHEDRQRPPAREGSS